MNETSLVKAEFSSQDICISVAKHDEASVLVR